MNIFGEGLPEQIIGQINRRQKTYGSGYAGATRTNEEILVLNANTGWIKLLSSVNIPSLETKAINNPSIKQLGLTGNTLATTYVLFNGTEGSTKILRSGVSNENSFGGDNYAYGIGGTDFGLNPMMGITSMTVNHENRGSLRRAVVKIRAHNKVQFEIIDVLYLRLGFQVLLEWGNAIYLDNDKGKYEPLITNNWSLADDFLNGSGNVKNDPPPGEKFKYFNYDDFLQRIHQNRLDSQGNYDAMFAKVTNFHWSVNKDGSYDIEVNLASIGDIIESLKVNVASKSLIQTKKQKIDKESEDITIQQQFILSRGKSAIGDFLSMPLIEVSTAEQAISYNQTGGQILANLIYSKLIADTDKTAGFIFFIHEQGINTSDRWSSVPYLQKLNALKSPPININMNLNDFKIQTQRDFININWDNAMSNGVVDATDPFTYVRLGTFLQFLQDVIVFQQKGVDANAPAKPGLRFDYDVETNIINAYDRQVSFDPKICVVNRTIDLSYNPENEEFSDTLKFPYSFAPTDKGQFPPTLPQDGGKYISDNLKTIGSYGKIMNVFVNSRFILEIIDNNKDEQGDVLLIDFLQKILDGISEGLGGLNNLDVFIDETLNMVKIIDKNPLKNRDTVLEFMNAELNKSLFPYAHKDKSQEISTALAKFQLFGYSGSSAGFVKDFTFKTELTPAFSTMITVGAAANKSVVGEENTALSRINKGLVDRYKETVVNIINPEKLLEEDTKLDIAITETEELLKIRNEEFEKFLYDMSYTAEFYHSRDGVEYNIDDINLHKTSLKELIDLEQKLKELKARKADEPTPPPSNTRDGFIPFNLSLTMDGLSGMKINEKFTVNTDFLPSNYPETVEFLIKNLTHEVTDNKWLTKIDSYCISKQAEASSVVKASPSPTPSPETAPLPVKTPPVKKEEPVITPKPTPGAKLLPAENYSDVTQCPTINGTLNEAIIKSTKIKYFNSPNFISGKKSFIEKLEKAYNIVPFTVGDALRDFTFQKNAHITNEKNKELVKANPSAKWQKYGDKTLRTGTPPNIAHPCKAYHVLGQAVDLSQIQEVKEDILSHGPLYKALYDQGLYRVSNEYWHWSIGETTHDINKKFTLHPNSPADYPNAKQY